MAFETGYTSTLALPVGASDTTITVATPPTATSGRMKIGRGTLRERISYSGVSGNTLTGCVRGLSRTATPATAGVGSTWLAGTTIKLVLMHDQILDTSNGNISGNLNVSGNITAGGNITADTITVNDILNLPVYVDATARDTAIPSPTNGMLVITNGDLQHYNGTTAQRETADTSTAPTNASETVKGVVQEATSSEITQGIGIGSTLARLYVNPEKLIQVTNSINTSINTAGGLTVSDSYILGENVQTNDSLFVEGLVAQDISTTALNVGDVTANTRVSVVAIGSDTSTSSFAINLNKTGSPSTDLLVRVETDNQGSPSGTLAHVNATATIPASKLGTSFLSTYQPVTDTDNITFTSTQASVNQRGYRIRAKVNGFITTINKSTTCTATRAIVKTDAGTTISIANFNGDIALFNSPIPITNLTYYRVELDGNGASITHHRLLSATFPQSRTNIDYITGSEGGVDTTTAYNIDNIITTEAFQFAGSVTLPKQRLHFVFNQTSNTVNGSNYFSIGQSSVNTSTRPTLKYNGSAWIGNTIGSLITDTSGVTYNNNDSGQTLSAGLKIKALSNIYITEVTKVSTCTATRLVLRDNSGTLLTTATFSGDVATLSTPLLVSNLQYIRVEVDNNGSSYTGRRNLGNYVGSVGTNIEFVALGGTINGIDQNMPYNIVSVGTKTVTLNNASMVYLSSTGVTEKLLAKTDASYTYKLPKYTKRLAKESKQIGQTVLCNFYGKISYGGLTEGNQYFVSDTDGLLSPAPGTNSYYMGTALNTTDLLLDYQDNIISGTTYTVASLAGTVSSTSTTFTKAKQTRVTKGGTYRVAYRQSITLGSVSEAQIYRNGVPYGTLYSANAVNQDRVESLFFNDGDTIEVRQRMVSGTGVNIQNFLVQYSLQSQNIVGVDNIG